MLVEFLRRFSMFNIKDLEKIMFHFMFSIVQLHNDDTLHEKYKCHFQETLTQKRENKSNKVTETSQIRSLK